MSIKENMGTVLSFGLRSVLNGMENALRHVREITESFPNSDALPVEALLELDNDKRQVQAGVRVIKTDQDLEKAVLDLLA